MRILIVVLLAVLPALAQPKAILGLYKGTEKVDGSTNWVKRFVEPELVKLGYSVDYHDITQGLPKDMSRYRGVVSWYQTASMENAAAYCRWLLEQIQAGRKVIILGSLGAYQELDLRSNPKTERWLLPHEYNQFLYPFGIEFKGMWTKDNKVLRVATRDPQMVPWLEDQHLGHYFWLQPVSPEDKVYLGVRRTDFPDSESAFVVRTPYGGYVLESYLFKDVTGKGEYRWHFDLAKFLKDALAYQPKSLPQSVTLTVKPTTPSARPARAVLPQAPPLPAGTTELKRKILAFYQRDLQEVSGHNRVHDVCETVLNHLGLVVEYRALEDPLPSDEAMAQYRGVVQWLGGSSIAGAQHYADWLKRQMDAGRLVVILGDYGAFADKSLSSQVNAAPTLAALGLEHKPMGTVNLSIGRTGVTRTLETPRVVSADPAVTKGEHPLNFEDEDLRKGWPVYVSTDPANKVYLRVRDREGQTTDAVVVTPRGGLVAGDFLIYIPPTQTQRVESTDAKTPGLGPAVAEVTELSRFRIDPFRFFAEAFQVEDFPRPDVTTLNGSRIYFSHIDGDAMHGISLIDRASLNAEMLFREILQKYQEPVTVSFVTSNLEFRSTPTYKRELEIARQILALPWVETASHSQNHPFNWRQGDLQRLPGEDVRLQRVPPDDAKEIGYSVDLINQLVAPPGKPVKLFLWSGACNPTAEQIALCDTMGIDNLNGGDPVYDSVNPYLGGVAPLYRVVNDQRYQYHTAAAGDFYYTGAWTRDYDGMKRLIEYFRYTEQPRRLRAMNLYYHFYLAERELGLAGLRTVLDYVRKQQPAPMFASDYIDVVKDFIVTRMGRDAQGNLVVANSGALRTIRFDKPVTVDVGRSRGVLGSLQVGTSTYVHLDDSRVHTIVTGTPAPGPFLERASHQVNGWKAGAGVSFTLHGTGPGHFTVASLAPSTPYRVSVAGQRASRTTDASGRLTWEGLLAEHQGHYPVEITR